MAGKLTYEELQLHLKQLEKELADLKRHDLPDISCHESLMTSPDPPGEISVNEILDIPFLQSLLDSLFLATGIPSTILDLNERVLTGSGWQEICTRFHRVHPDTRRQCKERGSYIKSHLPHKGFVEYCCPNGLWDFAISMRIDGRHVATFFLGQIFLEEELVDRDYFLNQSRTFGFDEQAYMNALNKVPVVSRERINSMLDFCEKFASCITSLGATNLSQARSIAERDRVQVMLSQSEKKYRLVVENATEAIFVGQDWGIKFSNPSFLTMTGYSEEDFAPPSSFSFLDIIHPDEREMALQNYQKRIRGEKVPTNLPYRIITKSGKEVNIELNGVRTTWEGESATLNFARDVTERKKMEAQLLHAQKMEAVGTLAGGIAHDFNNLLQVIQGFSEMLLLDKNEHDPGYNELYEIFHAAKRSAELTGRLLTFSRQAESKMLPVNLNDLLLNSQKLLERTIPKMISIEFHLDRDLKAIKADPVQIEQILMNLVLNARDAMSNEGRIMIETKNLALDEEYCEGYVEVRPGRYVLLSVSDSGAGMSKETLEHIFEPFYTTKEMGKGTGLGLATVYGIVKNHNGFIMCHSELGKGTTFKIYLPLSDRVAESFEAKTEEKLQGGSATVLLVDDEEMVRNLGKNVLERSGFKVFTAADGESALEFYRNGRNEIDLVILDLIMPGMGGKKCLEEILRLEPKAKVLIASGYAPDVSNLDNQKNGAAGFISKPYRISELLKAVDRAMQHN